MPKKINLITKKRFVIAKSMLGKGFVIHDEVFAKNQEKILSMPCFNEYGNYTNTNKLPKWAE